MRNKRLLGGWLFYGTEKRERIVVDGELMKMERGIYFLDHRGAAFFKYKPCYWGKFLVVNFTHRLFALGASTSGGVGLALTFADNIKRGGIGSNTHTRFSGALGQIGFWWFKFYFYLFFDGKGLG